jgi:hypothetical protein
MSGAHDAHGDHAAAAHHDDAAHHHDFDNEPAHELPPEEPRTPGWIPVLGLALFFVAGTAWLVMGSGDEDTTKAADQKPQAAAQANEGAQAPAPPQPQPQAPAPQARPAPAPPPAGSGALRQLTPEQAKEIQKQIEAIQQRRGPQQPQQPPQGAPAER